MIYLIFSIGKSAEWDELRIFTSFSSVEQAALKQRACYVVAYDGVDELVPVWMYQIVNGRLQQFSL